MRELDKISDALFNKIRARVDSVNIGNENAERVTDPEQARFFNFDYIGKNGKNYGNVTLSLIDENALKIYFSSNLSSGLDEEEQKEWYEFLHDLRHFARRNMLTFDTRDINRSNLELKDLRQQSKSDSTFDKDEVAIAEGKLYGMGNNKRMSFDDIGTHKIIIKHRDQINPDKRGDRTRQIEHIFVETPVGERFLLDHTNLHGARAIANHLRHGGGIGDEGSNLINEMVREMASMKHFVRSMRNRTFEDQETTGMVEAAIHRYNEVKDHLKRFRGRNGQELLVGMLQNNSANTDEDIDVDALRERFVKKIYDDRFNDALPYVYRAYKQKQESDTPIGMEFESWANEITEQGNDENERANIELSKLIVNPILVGMDGIDAAAALKHIVNDETLNTAFVKLAKSQGPDADARRVFAGWLAAEGEDEAANMILQILQRQNQPTQPQPTSPEVSKQNYGAPTTDSPVVSEDLDSMKWLAGLVKK